MYWGDANLDIMETAYINGTGRRILLTERTTHYFDFLVYDGYMYFTDWEFL